MEFWKRVYGLARPFRWMLAATLCITVMAQVIGFLPMLANKEFFDSAERWVRGEDVTETKFALVLAAMVATGILSEIGTQAAWYVSDRLQKRMSQRMNVTTSDHLLRLSLGYHTCHDTPEKTRVVDRGLGGAADIVWGVLIQLLPSCCMWAVFLGWTIMIAPLPALIMVVGSVLMIALATRMQRRIRPMRRGMRDAGNVAHAYMSDMLRNVRTVKATATEPSVVEEIARHGEIHVTRSGSVARLMACADSAQAVLRHVVSGTILAVALWQMLHGDTTLGTVTMLYGISQRLMTTAQNAAGSYASVERARPDVEKLFELLDVRPDVVSPANPVPLGTMLGSIAFENVSFAYPDTDGTIRDVSLFVPAGRTVAVVGTTGAGKSTLATLLLRGFDPHGGRILVDGKDLRTLDLCEYLSQIGIVIQGVGLLSMSVRDNIAFGTEGATPERIEEAARMVGAHEFILAMRDGYDTQVGEGGVRLSGGQVQRIALARALMRNPRLLILDEATSQLDEGTQAEVMGELVGRVHGTRTVVVIAHRLSTVRFADEIVVLDRGRVVEQGTYDDLARGNGAFRRLVEASAS